MRIKKSVIVVLVLVLLGVAGIFTSKALKNDEKPIDNDGENISLKSDTPKDNEPVPNPPEPEEPIEDEKKPQIDSVPLQEEIADTYFDDAVFIGDSRTEGFMIYENVDAIIYVESILPVSEEVSLNHDYIKMSKINEYNDLLKEMAKEKSVYYLDISSAVANEQGYLPVDAATDGIHLNKNYCDKWLQYLKTHYIVEN